MATWLSSSAANSSSERRDRKRPRRRKAKARNFGMVSLLFAAQGAHGIDMHGAPRGYVAGRQRDGHQQRSDAGQCPWIVSPHAIEHRAAGHQLRQSERSGEAGADADESEAAA